MDRIRVLIIAVLLAALAAGREARADFDDLGAGARAIGMGNAYAALADDPFGFYYNPAGLGYIRQSQIGADYGKLWLGLTDKSDMSAAFMSVALPVFRTEKVALPESGDVAVSSGTEVNKSTSAVEIRYQAKRNHIGTVLVGLRYFNLLGNYTESAYYVGWGRLSGKRLAWGVNLKMLSEQYAVDDYMKLSPVFDYGDKTSVSAFSADAGVIYNILPRLFIGASGSDLNQPDLGLSAKDQLPATARAGIGWRQKDLSWDADAVYRAGRWYGSFGVEKWVIRLFALRGGITAGGMNYFQPSFGFSFNLRTAQIDYAFTYPVNGVRDVSGTHRMSIVYKFGTRSKEEIEPGSLEYYYAELQEKNKTLEANLAATQAEKKRLEDVLIEEATMRIREKIKAAKTEAKEARPAEQAQVSDKEIRHVVRKGDTLQSIAEKYYGDSKYWNEIYQVNRENIGRGGALKPDQVLIIPMAGKGEKTAQAEDQKVLKPGITPAVQPVEVTPVTVVPVQQAPAQPASPLALPGMRPAQGQVIPEVVPVTVIAPEKSTSAAAAVEKPKETAKPEKKQAVEKPKPAGPRKHIVQAGENLRSIAQKYYNDSGKWKDIYKANSTKITGGQVLPGQEIIIP